MLWLLMLWLLTQPPEPEPVRAIELPPPTIPGAILCSNSSGDLNAFFTNFFLLLFFMIFHLHDSIISIFNLLLVTILLTIC